MTLWTRQQMLEQHLREIRARDSGSGPEGGDAKQAPGEAPQSGLSEGEGIAPNPSEAA